MLLNAPHSPSPSLWNPKECIDTAIHVNAGEYVAESVYADVVIQVVECVNVDEVQDLAVDVDEADDGRADLGIEEICHCNILWYNQDKILNIRLH